MKHSLYRGKITSAEDFIAKIATATVMGRPYVVLLQDGAKRDLNEWLLEALREYRARRASGDASAQDPARAGPSR